MAPEQLELLTEVNCFGPAIGFVRRRITGCGRGSDAPLRLTACPATSPAYSILVLRVTVPGHKQPVFASTGLARNGTVARIILYSLRAA